MHFVATVQLQAAAAATGSALNLSPSQQLCYRTQFLYLSGCYAT
jgi:hypothetical protein